MSTPQIQIQPLDKRLHDRASFNCQNDALNTFLRERAANLQGHIAATHVATLANAHSNANGLIPIVGFYSLSSHAIETADVPLTAKERKKLPKYPRLPCVLLGQLAVDHRHRRCGYGEALVFDALIRCRDNASQIAAYAVLVDAISDEAARFWTHMDFRPFPNTPSKFFLPITDIPP